MSAATKAKRVVILALDDEPSNNEMVVRTLASRQDCRVLTATSGTEALRIVKQEPVDILLVDFVMPGMNGEEFVDQARTIVPDVIAVMITAFPELVEVVRAQRRGIFERILVKPWQPAKLLTAVSQVIAPRQR